MVNHKIIQIQICMVANVLIFYFHLKMKQKLRKKIGLRLRPGLIYQKN